MGGRAYYLASFTDENLKPFIAYYGVNMFSPWAGGGAG